MTDSRRGGSSERSAVIVRSVGTPRSAAAARAMDAAGVELGRVLSAAVGEPMWARLVALRGLEADDAFGRGQGLLVQHDEVRWADVLDVVELSSLVERLGHPLPACARTSGCVVCRAGRALQRLRRIWAETGLSAEAVRAEQQLMVGPPARPGTSEASRRN